jgi:probable aminopeptidase NPEPL1
VATLTLASNVSRAADRADHLLILAPKAALAAGAWRAVLGEAVAEPLARALSAMVTETDAGPLGKVVTTWWSGEDGAARRVSLGVLPDAVSRHLSPSRNHAVAECCAKADLRGERVGVVLVLDEAAHLLPCVVAAGRAFRRFQRKSSKKPAPKVTIAACSRDGAPIAPSETVERTLEVSRWVAELVDTPTDEKSTADLSAAAKKLVSKKAKAKELVGDALIKAGLRGVHAVGRAAEVAPRMLVLSHKARNAKLRVALVGKGIVFDTGGLHIKPRGGMEGMKSDMGGAAAVVAAFDVLVREGVPVHLWAITPLAENAVGPRSYRPDEILTLHSGKTVEINNTDAEGRLLLADAVSWAARELEPDLIIDAATLTGAQGVSTGKRHAAVVSNRAGLEALAVRAGRTSGDLVHPLPFAPELYQSEFKSEVADMTNSVKDRSNAQSSCAAQFIYGHISDLDTPWLHVDLASPAHVDGKGTGFGAALLAEVVRSVSKTDLAS